jgi:LacI family transcriptional regulator
MAAASAVETVGKSVGVEVDIVGKETSRLLHLFRPGIITYFEDITRAGEFLARAAVSAVENPDAHPLQELEVPDPCGFQSAEQVLREII